MRIIIFRLAMLCTALLTTLVLNGQDLRPAVLVDEARVAESFEERFEISTITKSTTPVAILDEVGAPYDLLDLKPNSLAELRKAAPEILELTFPETTGNISLDRTNIFADGFKVNKSGSNNYQKTALGLHHQGIVSGDLSSLVAISIFEEEVSGIIATDAGNFILSKLTKGEPHILYNDKDLPAPDLEECATIDSALPYSPKELIDLDPGQKDVNNCVNLYMEADYSIFQQRGSSAPVTSFITGLVNQVTVRYANENINLVMSELFVWTTNAPYNSGSSSCNLNAFLANRNSFNGDIAPLVSFQASGGGCTDNVTTITILTDNYPNETAWTLTNTSGTTVASGSGYTYRNTTYTEETCLLDGCYTFSITDSYGDGICCAYGRSTCIAIIPGAGEPIITSPQASLNNQLETLHVFPNPASGLLNLEVSVKEATTSSVRIVDVTGRTQHKLQQRLHQDNQQTTLAALDFPVGTYRLRLEAANGYSDTTKFMVTR